MNPDKVLFDNFGNFIEFPVVLNLASFFDLLCLFIYVWVLENSEYFWEGYSSTMFYVLKNCHRCASLTKNIAEKPVMKHLIPDGPHFRYQSDILELSKIYF